VKRNGLFILALFLSLAPALVAQSTNAVGGQVFGWTVKSPTATVHLVGSIHLAKPDLYPLNPKIEAAFGQSQALVVEVDVGRQADLAQQMMVKAAYPAGDTIDKHVSAELLQRADAQLGKSGLGLVMLAQFKPWLIAQTVLLMELQRLGFSPTHGIDMYFLQKARGNKKILELETADSQIDLLNSFSDKEQELFLLYTLNDLENIEKNLNEIIDSWKQGDAPRMEKYLTDSVKDAPELQAVYRKLIDDRNVGMAQKIIEYLKTQDTYFVVVGSAHLVGENGVPNLIKKAGHPVDPL
jgi:uncharacterized protein YbaP (TraB family)